MVVVPTLLKPGAPLRATARYRVDIDALRGLAVLAVVIFHADFAWRGQAVLGGGFLGVDVFFVISGYLITAQILRQRAKGVFSLRDFYDRRARRILPALFVVMLATVAVSSSVMDPNSLRALGREVLAALGFSSNILFALEDPYFAEAAQVRPLLHTWTLGVEEQFYLLWPLVLLLLAKTARVRAGIAVVGMASFALAVWLSETLPQVAFYGLPTRAWELMAGAGLAAACGDRGAGPGRRGDAAVAVGLIAITVPMLFWSGSWAHPSWVTALPVGGTVAVIWAAREGGAVARGFATVGRVSYSLYLWHFAVLALARAALGPELPLGTTLLCLAGSALAAVVSYRAVEQPLRRRSGGRPLIEAKTTYAVLGILGLGLLGSGTLLAARGGVRGMSADVAALVGDSRRSVFRSNGRICRDRQWEDACRFAGSGRPIYLVGDSHAGAMAAPLVNAAAELDRPVTLLLHGGCPVLFRGAERGDFSAARREGCARSSESFLEGLLLAEPGTVVYSAWLPAYFGMGEEAPLVRTVDGGDLGDVRSGGVTALNALVSAGHDLVLVESLPRLDTAPADALLSAFAGQKEVGFKELRAVAPSTPLSDHNVRLARTRSMLADVRNATQVIAADLTCVDGLCESLVEGRLAYSDTNHPSPYGAELIVEKILERID